jgi:hypothetical protein
MKGDRLGWSTPEGDEQFARSCPKLPPDGRVAGALTRRADSPCVAFRWRASLVRDHADICISHRSRRVARRHLRDPRRPALAIDVDSVEDRVEMQWGIAPVDALDAIHAAYQGNVVGQVYDGNRVFDVSACRRVVVTDLTRQLEILMEPKALLEEAGKGGFWSYTAGVAYQSSPTIACAAWSSTTTRWICR